MVIHTNSWNYSAAVILQQKGAKIFIVFTLCNEGEELEEVANSLVDIEKHKAVSPHQSMKELFCPVGMIRHTIVEIDGQLIEYISEEVMNVEVNRIMEDYQRRQIPRFR